MVWVLFFKSIMALPDLTLIIEINHITDIDII